MFVTISKVFLAAVLLATGLNKSPVPQVTCTGTVMYEPVGGQGMPVMYYPSYFDPANATRYTGFYLRLGQVVTVYEAIQKPDNNGEIWYRISANTYVQGLGAGTFRMVALSAGCPMP